MNKKTPRRNNPLVLSVTSGKGGVGKTSVSVNLAYCLSRMGQRVVLLDADLGLANVDVLLGIAPEKNLFHLFHEGIGVRDILYKTPYGFDILPAASGVSDMVSLSQGQKLDLLEAMDFLDDKVDYFIVDTGAGINDTVLYFNMAVQERIVVLTPEPTSLTDAYALIKVLKTDHGIDRFRILLNQARSKEVAMETFRKLYMACDHFLTGVSLDLVGVIPYDAAVRQAIIKQQPFCHLLPDAPSSKKVRGIAQTITTWDALQLDGNIKFFWKKLIFQGQPVA